MYLLAVYNGHSSSVPPQNSCHALWFQRFPNILIFFDHMSNFYKSTIFHSNGSKKHRKKWNWWRQQWSGACPTECPETDRKELGLPHPSLNVRKEGVSWLRFDVGSDSWLNWTCPKTWKAADTRLLRYIRRGCGIQGLGFTSKMRSWTEDQDPKHREEPSRGTASGSVFGHHETRRTDHIFFSPNAGSRVMRIYENAVIENTGVHWSGGEIDPRSNQDRW